MSEFVPKAIRWGAVCITGNYRANNEDNYLADPDGHYFLVADGMGGSSAGERASAMAVQLVSQKLNDLIDFNIAPPEQVTAAIDVQSPGESRTCHRRAGLGIARRQKVRC